ncbi:MAG: S8 family serine peptidase [Ignavibacteria bacterium]|nr:S8 family serine peptidase [Ignavibacteria bacterium]
MTMSRAIPLLTAFLITVSASALIAGQGPGSVRGSGKTDRLSQLSGPIETQAGVVIVKFAVSVKSAMSKRAVDLPALSPAFLRYGVTATEQMYPSQGNAFTASGQDIGLDRMYRVTFDAAADPLDVARALAAVPGVEYAEPERIHRLSFVPNDAMLSQQYAIDRMQLKQAWDITKGKPEIVIGVVDSGVHWTHEDLRENVWVNPGEDINRDGKYTTADLNGKDDDADGYIDNIIGIDFAGADGTGGGKYYDVDPLPTATGNDHGTHVAGIIAAVGNNSKGVAGVAFQCRYLPVKCGTDNSGSTILRGYDGIVYAADKGATIINCSWGGTGGYLQSEIDRIDYALSKGATVVAAAGNDAADGIFTPACYPNILSVASTGPSDRASGFTNYSTWVSVSAPGDNIVSAVSRTNSSYSSMSGTSMASPEVAGVLALVASHRPDLRGRALAEQVRVTSDNIDSLQAGRYARKLGYGRVNALRALTLSLPSVRMVSFTLSDAKYGNGNTVLERGEKLELRMRWKNFLGTTKNATVKLSSPSPNVTILNPDFTLGTLGTNEEKNNEADPFVIQLADVEALNEQLDMFFTITDDGYSDYGGLSFIQQPTYRDHNANEIVTTISNDGNIGFDDFTGVRGKGYIFRNNGFNVLFEGALMIGATVNGSPQVVDVARNESGNVQCADFVGATPVVMTTPGTIAAQEGITEFTDNSAPEFDKIGVTVKLHTYEFIEAGLTGLVFLKYTIINTSAQTLTDLHAGLFFDWDIGVGATSDLSDFDTTSLTAFAYEAGTRVPTVIGATVLSRGKPTHFVSINNPDADSKTVFGIHNGFTKEEKWRALSSGIWHIQSIVTDVAQVIANGPYALSPGDSCVVGFALSAGLSPADVIKLTPKALDAWTRLISPVTTAELPAAPGGFGIVSAYPHPFRAGAGNTLTAVFDVPSASSVSLELIDALGRRAATLVSATLTPGRHNASIAPSSLPPGMYTLRLAADGKSSLRRIVLQR